MDTQSPARRERFRLDQSRFSAHVIAEGEHFGIRGGDDRGFAPAIVSRFEDALAAKAILGPVGLEPRVYAVAADFLIVAVRASKTPSCGPLCQVATYAIETSAIAYLGDESFAECCRVIEALLEHAGDLVASTAILCRIQEALRLPAS